MSDKKNNGERNVRSRHRGGPAASARPPRDGKPVVGMVEWFRPGDHDRVDRVLDDLQALGVSELRTGISWADCYTPEGEAWHAWLFPQLARRVNVLPCFLYTPPSWGVVPKTSAPPREARSYADFLDLTITRYGKHFEWVELWNEPNNVGAWDVALDPYWITFTEMIGNAAHWVRKRGKKALLGGLRPIDPNWLRLMGERGLLAHLDAVGIHGFPVPAAEDGQWDGWAPQVAKVRDVLRQFGSDAQVWITKTGYSTWRHDERRQLTAFVDAIEASVDRAYWYGVHDVDPTAGRAADHVVGDESAYHFGLVRADGGEKLLFRLWKDGGLDAVRDAYWLGKGAHVSGGDGSADRPVLITGGSGFIGTNLAHRLLTNGQSVLLFDNLSRAGVERNLKWLRQVHGDRLQIEAADVLDPHVLRHAVERSGRVFHFAAQVAVTTSLVNAVHDFEVNARGTLNLLEAIRAQDNPPPLVFTSTNKVYGGLPDVAMRVNGSRYEPADEGIRSHGISEARALDFHSPYGCSKGAADQYVVDYARTFGLPAVVFRMSCIYGPHQFGNEDQGWVAHFIIKAIRGEPLTIYGDGMQVRDVLFVDDLVDAFLLAQAKMPSITGQAFNIGGGPGNVISLIELLDLIEQLHRHRPEVRYGAWRPGDQRYYVSDTRKMAAATGWRPAIDVREGVSRLYDWLMESWTKRRRPRGPQPGRGREAAWRDPEAAASERAATKEAR